MQRALEFVDRIVVEPRLFITNRSLSQIETMMHGFDVGAVTDFNRKFMSFARQAGVPGVSRGWAYAITQDAYARKQRQEMTSPWERFTELYLDFKVLMEKEIESDVQ